MELPCGRRCRLCGAAGGTQRAQVLASADWLGRDVDGNEQLLLGAWSLADVTNEAAAASFRLGHRGRAKSVPDGLDPEGVRIALEGGKHWGATDQARYDAWAAQQQSSSYDEISTGALRQRLSSRPDDLLLLDVRPLASSAADAIEGAVRIPWPTIESGAALDQVRSLAAGKDVHVICQSGGWSAASSQFLEDQGIEVTNVAGGMNAWSSMKASAVNNAAASGVPDGLDPEGVKIALEGGKHWGATDQARYDAWAAQHLSTRGTGPSGLTLEAADGTGICAEDEFLFEVSGGKANGDVSIDVDLSLVGLPEASQVWFSATGAEDSWQEYNYKKDPSELTKLSGEGTGYIKVKLPDETSAVGSDLKVSLTQYDNDLEGDNPVLDLNYERLNADGAVRLKDENGKFVVNYEAHKKWDDSETKNGAIYKDAYRYTDLYPELQKQGYRLEADVSLEFYAPKEGVKNYSFDDKERFGDDPVSDKTYLERFQTRFDGTQGNSNGNSFDTGISYVEVLSSGYEDG